jgi:glycosyltransferase involved in cell wall biosynthesis
MKILYVSNGSNFSGAGGMEHHLIDITDWLKGKGVDVALAVRKGTFFERCLLSDKPRVYALSWTGFGKIFSIFQAAKMLLDFSPDIVSINRERDIIRIFFITKIMSLFLKKKPKIVSVFHNLGWRSSFKLGKLDGIIFPNNFIKQDYIPRNRSAEAKSAIIYHGIRLPKTAPAEILDPWRERKYFKGRGFPIIGMIGELRKNQTELLDVAHQLKKKIPDFTLAFVGGGTEEEKKTLKEKADRLGLANNVIITGRVERERMPDVFYDLDVSVTTNRHEPFGLVFIESLAAYTPLVAYNSGGPVEILQKGGGVLVQDGPEEMAVELVKLVSDQDRRRAIAMSGRAAAEKYFSIDAMGAKHYNFYENMMKAGSAESAEEAEPRF